MSYFGKGGGRQARKCFRDGCNSIGMSKSGLDSFCSQCTANLPKTLKDKLYELTGHHRKKALKVARKFLKDNQGNR